jgi:hypothetical protein
MILFSRSRILPFYTTHGYNIKDSSVHWWLSSWTERKTRLPWMLMKTLRMDDERLYIDLGALNRESRWKDAVSFGARRSHDVGTVSIQLKTGSSRVSVISLSGIPYWFMKAIINSARRYSFCSGISNNQQRPWCELWLGGLTLVRAIPRNLCKLW